MTLGGGGPLAAGGELLRGAPVVIGWCVASLGGGALAFVLARRWTLLVAALALTAFVAVGVAVTEDGVRDALRAVGWNGA